MKMTVTGKTIGLTLNAPEAFKREDFRAWLNDKNNRIATWHHKGEEPHEYSDIFVGVDSEYEGSDSDMPEDIWKAVCDAAYSTYSHGNPRLPTWITSHIVVRLTNLPEKIA